MFANGKQSVNYSERELVQGVSLLSFPEQGTCCGMPGRTQAFCVIKLPCSGNGIKTATADVAVETDSAQWTLSG